MLRCACALCVAALVLLEAVALEVSTRGEDFLRKPHHRHHVRGSNIANHSLVRFGLDDTPKRLATKSEKNVSRIVAKPWSYKSVDDWKVGYPVCARHPGRQSPIALKTQSVAGGESISKHVEYSVLSGCVLRNTGQLLELDGDNYFGTFGLGKMVWHARRIQFHTPSEHSLDGSHFDGELQIVHERKGSAPLIVSVFLREGPNPNALLSSLGFDMLNMPRAKGQKMSIPGVVDLAEGLKAQFAANYLSYTGSITKPPCTEGVQWFVSTLPLEASGAQLQNLRRRFPHGNNRPLQPVGLRAISSEPAVPYSGASTSATMHAAAVLLAAVVYMQF